MEPKIKAILAGGVLVIAVVAIWLTQHTPTPPVNPAVYTTLGQLLAAQTEGPVVAVTFEASLRSGTLWHDQWNAFRAELEKRHTPLLATEVITEADALSRRLPAPSFRELAARHPTAGAVVFFNALPDLDWLNTTGATSKVVAFDNGDLPKKAHYARYFQLGFVTAIIIPQGDTYRVLTPQNYESLPE